MSRNSENAFEKKIDQRIEDLITQSYSQPDGNVRRRKLQKKQVNMVQLHHLMTALGKFLHHRRLIQFVHNGARPDRVLPVFSWHLHKLSFPLLQLRRGITIPSPHVL